MQKKQVTSIKIFYFEKYGNNSICDQQYAICNKSLGLARLYFPKAVVGVGSRLDFVRTNLFPQPFFIFFVDARFPVREQRLRWKWMFF